MSRQKKPTIYQVAKKAGVAISTVSRVLNDSPNVSEETTKKVKEAIKELRFRPQASARMLASRQPQMIAIAVPSFTTPFYTEILKGIKDEMREKNLDIMIYNTGSRNPEKAVDSFFDRGTADAVIILSIQISEDLKHQIQASNIPTVLIGSQHPEFSFFDPDDEAGGALAAEHLARQGYVRPGIILSSLPTRAATLRRKGFETTLSKHGITLREEFCYVGENTKHAGFSEENGFEVARAIIEAREKGQEIPDALFCLNDTQAIGAMYAFTQAGIRIPEDIAVMGYDNIKFTRFMDLTTVDQKMHTIGVEATRHLLELLHVPSTKPIQKVMEPILVKRDSTALKA